MTQFYQTLGQIDYVPADAIPSRRGRLENPAATGFEVVGRLRDGVTAGQATAAVRVATEVAARRDLGHRAETGYEDARSRSPLKAVG